MTVLHFQINGLSGTGQAQQLQSEIQTVPGVSEASVSSETGSITVVSESAGAASAVARGACLVFAEVLRSATDAGYEIASRRPSRHQRPFTRWVYRGWLGVPGGDAAVHGERDSSESHQGIVTPEKHVLTTRDPGPRVAVQVRDGMAQPCA